MHAVKTILEVQDLKITFEMGQQLVQAVNGVSFAMKEGETFGFVGESGCGKSTTSRAIIRLLSEKAQITDGSIHYFEQDILNLSEEELRKVRGRQIGMIFQEPMTALNPVLTVKKQIYEQFSGRKMSAKEKKEKAIELLRLVGIPSPEKRLHEYIHQFSGGMRQRAMIAIALAGSPRLLIADEPTTALDVTIQDQIMKLLNRLRRELGMSVLLITHDLGVISQMCDRVAVMYAGYIVETADVFTLFSTPRHPYTKGLIDALPNTQCGGMLKPIEGAMPNLAKLPAGCPFAQRCSCREAVCENTLPEMRELTPGHFSRCFFPEKMEGQLGLIDCCGKGDAT